jgi:hypothetical protein
MSSQQSPANLQSSVDRDKIYQWIIELSNPETRENALLELRYSVVLHLQLLEHAFEPFKYLHFSYFMFTSYLAVDHYSHMLFCAYNK